MDDETFERIPWEQLSGSKPSRSPVPPRTIAYLAAAALVVAGLTATLVSRGEAVPPGTTLTVTTVPTTLSTTTSISLLSEAALMAIPGAAAEAGAWAEWITEAYLTMDGSDATELASLFPPGTALPTPAPGQRVFVESARTISVTEVGANYRAVVLARILGALGEEGYGRLPDRGLAWTLRWDPAGWVVVDLPEEIPTPRLQSGDAFVTNEVPEPILTVASEEGLVIGGGQVGDLWRVVVSVKDSLGGTWPVVIWFSPDGSPVVTTSG